MICGKCGREYADQHNECPYCHGDEDSSVRVLTPEESKQYTGVTIDDDGNYDEPRMHSQTSGRQKIYVRSYGFGSGSSSSKLLTYLIGAAVVGFVLFVALPMLLTVLGAGIVVYFILRLFKG